MRVIKLNDFEFTLVLNNLKLLTDLAKKNKAVSSDDSIDLSQLYLTYTSIISKFESAANYSEFVNLD